MPFINRSSAKNKSALKLLMFSFAAALIMQLICSKSSPLYPANDWVDVNCFFTVGKTILNGWVPYRDICEQKGPLLYLIYAGAAWISDTGFIGAFVFDVLGMTAFLYFSGKIIVLLSGTTRLVYPAVLIMSLFVHTCTSFVHGGSAEGLCLWTLACSMFIVLRMFEEKRPMRKTEGLCLGIVAAFVFYIKFNLCTYFAGLALTVLLLHLFSGWKRQLGGAIGSFFLGFAAASAPVILYFGLNGALIDLWQGYFYNNIFQYGDPEMYRAMNILGRILRAAWQNPQVFVPVMIGGIWILLHIRSRWRMLLAIALSYGFLVPGVYWNNFFHYYGLIFAPAMVFGFAAVCRLLKQASKMLKIRFPARAFAAGVLALSVVSSGAAYCLSENTAMLGMDKKELPMYRFAETIRGVENATLLNYGFLDGGFYHAAGILPDTKYFCILWANIPEMYSTQREIVETGAVDFVVSKDQMLEDVMPDPLQYTCVDSADYVFEGQMCRYFLYRKI